MHTVITHYIILKLEFISVNKDIIIIGDNYMNFIMSKYKIRILITHELRKQHSIFIIIIIMLY